jgi:hypothetical protein
MIKCCFEILIFLGGNKEARKNILMLSSQFYAYVFVYKYIAIEFNEIHLILFTLSGIFKENSL